MEINIPMSIKMGEDEILLKDFSELYAYYVIFDVLNGLLKYIMLNVSFLVKDIING